MAVLIRDSHFSFRNVRQGFSRFAASYDNHAQLQQSVLFNAMRDVEQYFKPNMHMLDAGCGTGYLAELLRSCDIPFNVAALDSAPGMCAQASRRELRDHAYRVTCGDLLAMPYKSSIFDIVMSSLTMQWIFPRQDALAEFHRVLKPGGCAVITTFGPMTLQELRWSFGQVDDAPHVSEFAEPEAIIEWAKEGGFTVESTRSEFRVVNYESVKKLMAEIRAIGASNKLESRRKSLTGRKRFQQMEEVYKEAYETERGIPASWEVFYIVLRKKERFA
ncbi:MAG: methyltransferase domain-containing protein [Alphaproteobacteria bacterium]|nr:methyltransferase domain-containing protein [Alphaproteobacteria bacterium]